MSSYASTVYRVPRTSRLRRVGRLDLLDQLAVAAATAGMVAVSAMVGTGAHPGALPTIPLTGSATSQPSVSSEPTAGRQATQGEPASHRLRPVRLHGLYRPVFTTPATTGTTAR